MAVVVAEDGEEEVEAEGEETKEQMLGQAPILESTVSLRPLERLRLDGLQRENLRPSASVVQTQPSRASLRDSKPRLQLGGTPKTLTAMSQFNTKSSWPLI